MAPRSLTTRTAAPCLSVVDGTVTTLSTHVAAHFGKQHRDVLRAIENLVSQLAPERLRNFAHTVIERPNPAGGEPIKSPAYRLTRDGFTLLAMGFTGKRALQFKLAYIDAFNRMEAELRQQQAVALPAPTPQRWLMQVGVAGRLETTPLADDAMVTTWPEIANALRYHPDTVPRDLVLGLAEAATRAAFQNAASSPRGEGEEIARAIRDAGDALSLADLNAIATAASMEQWSRVNAHANGRAGSPASRIKNLLKP